MSQDKFWEQWGAGSGQAEQKPGDEKEKEKAAAPPAVAPDPTASASSLDADVLAAWLNSLPPSDPVVPPPAPAASAQPANPAELAELWPPPQPVDPFAGLQANAPAPASTDWDLALDLDTAPSPSGTTTEAPSAPSSFDLGGLAGPTPQVNPFAPPGEAPTAPADGQSAAPSDTQVRGTDAPPSAPVISPFGPPPPPPTPPAEVLSAPPLKLEIASGRRKYEQVVQGEALIGRPDTTRQIRPEIDLRTDDAVSRRHAKIFVRNGRYVVTDLNSTNGTRCNDQWLAPEEEVVLKPGDRLEVGEVTVIRVVEAPEADA